MANSKAVKEMKASKEEKATIADCIGLLVIRLNNMTGGDQNFRATNYGNDKTWSLFRTKGLFTQETLVDCKDIYRVYNMLVLLNDVASDTAKIVAKEYNKK